MDAAIPDRAASLLHSARNRCGVRQQRTTGLNIMEPKPHQWWRDHASTLLGYFQQHAQSAGGPWRVNERIARHFVELLEHPDLSEAELKVLQAMLGTRDAREGTGWYEFKSIAASWIDQSLQSRSPEALDAYAHGFHATTDPIFLASVRACLVESGEVLALVLYHAEPGERRFRLLTTFEGFEAFVATLRPRACLMVFKNRQLPIRGCVDDHFIAHVLESISDGAAWLAVPLAPTLIAGEVEFFQHANGTRAAALLSELLARHGKDLAVGPDPHPLERGDDVVSGIVPHTDGRVLIGIY